jgi:hypothetical protein
MAIQWKWAKDDGWEWVGRKSNQADYATMKQSGDLCWATSMAMACAMLIGDPKKRSVLKDTEKPSWWAEYAREYTSGVDDKGGKIQSTWFVSLVDTTNEDPGVPVACTVFTRGDMPMEKVAGNLRGGAIVLLHSANHVVVLSALAVDADRNVKYRVTDPARGEYQAWDQEALDKFKHVWVSIVRKK